MKFLTVALVLLAANTAAAQTNTTCAASAEQFAQLRTGMSYGTAARIIGCPGEEVSRSEIAGHSTIMYGWRGKGSFGSNMNAMFQNGALITKAQFGLR